MDSFRMNNIISSVVLVTLLALFSLRVIQVKSVNSNNLSFLKRFEVIGNNENSNRYPSYRWVSKRNENSTPIQAAELPDSATNTDQTGNPISVESASQDPIRVPTIGTLQTENIQRNDSEQVVTNETVAVSQYAELPSGPVLSNAEASAEVESIVEESSINQDSNATSLAETTNSGVKEANNTQQQLAQQILVQPAQIFPVPQQLPNQQQQEIQKVGEIEGQQEPPEEPPESTPSQQLKSQTQPSLEAPPKLMSEPQETTEGKEQDQSQEIDNKKPDVESVQEAKLPTQVITNEIGATKKAIEPINNSSSKAENVVETTSYKLESSCNFTSIIPDEIIDMAVQRILGAIRGEKCGLIVDSKLKPMINQQIKGFVMEVSSMPIDLDILTGAESTQVSCSSFKNIEPGKKMKFNMIFSQDLGNKRLESKWRSYSELQHDDIPVRVFDSTIARRGQSKISSKCQKFKLELGDFYLDLISFKTKLIFEIILVKLDEEIWSTKDNIGGGRILLKSIQINELYLDDKINLDSIGRRKLNIASPTVQILHDHNNHFRRNNWLLDLYGNWLKHEYKQQILELLGDASLLRRLNSCFTN